MSYLTPKSTEEALALLGQAGADVLAGGTDFFPSRGARPQTRSILDLGQIESLCGIEKTAQGWRIGAMTTWSQIQRADLPPAFDALKRAAREVGSVQIQNRGTIAGNLCNASPAADGVPPLLALDAEVEIGSPGATRRVLLSDFVTGVRRVALSPGELVLAVHVPSLPDDAVSHFLKLGSRRYLVISIAMTAAVLELDGPRIATARVAVGACSPVAQRLPELEAALVGLTAAEVAALPVVPETHLAPLAPIADVRGSAAYRMRAVADLCRRTVIAAMTGGTTDE